MACGRWIRQSGLAADAPEFDFSRARATSQQMYDEQQPPVAVSPRRAPKSAESTGVDPRHYKTRLCVYLGGGGCPHGARCFFAHSQEELRPPAAATCAEYKTRPCRYSLAECPFAAAGRCQFAHSLDELRQVLLIWPRPRRSGYPPDGFKTRLCKYFMAGHCPYAATNTRQFAHSNDELRAPRATPRRRSGSRVPFLIPRPRRQLGARRSSRPGPLRTWAPRPRPAAAAAAARRGAAAPDLARGCGGCCRCGGFFRSGAESGLGAEALHEALQVLHRRPLSV